MKKMKNATKPEISMTSRANIALTAKLTLTLGSLMPPNNVNSQPLSKTLSQKETK